ncbi:amidohydrolase [Collinsella sp. An2]|uniref:amidohydrolase n=1 Tax=Collinsella sp. An2 TaxID=1965585 RepID=UPI000B3A895C|nr:amidohydrolase [Collinsella sp. An2]OUP07567.1 hypothetical protein B5F33_08665 [Collinsella sp. An2]
MAHACTRFVNGRIWTGDPALPHVDSLVVADERLAWVGARVDMPAAYAHAETVDLHGARVMPGFVDAHMHALMLADYSKRISALPPKISSIEELVAAIRARRAQQEPDAWVLGWGYDEGLLAEHRSPTRWDLDRGCADAPVCIMRSCGHIRCVNSRALELAGITRDTPDPEGGEIERDAAGEPTGVLKENARELVFAVMPKRSKDELVRDIVDLGKLLASQGIVAATDMCMLDGGDAFPPLAAAGRAGLEQDVASYMLWDYVKDDPTYSIAPELMDRRNRVFMAGIKLLCDGSVSGRTAWFDLPYRTPDGTGTEESSQNAGTCGLPTCTEQDIDDAIAFCRRTGCQLSLHAMGTRAIDRAATRIAAHGAWPVSAGRNVPFARIEHATAPSSGAVATMAREGIAVVTQPIFPYAEIGTYLENLGTERTRRSYPLRTLLDAGVDLCISTDAPATSWATPSDPFPNIKAAVTRRAYDGTDFGQEQALTISEALTLYTRSAAHMAGFEGLGMLRAGYKASFIVLDRDVLHTSPDELDRTGVVATYIRGHKVFER